jgi:hypothetical protein
MKHKKHQNQSREQLSFSEQLRQSVVNKPCEFAKLWGCAGDSFIENKRKQRIYTTIEIVVGVIIGALVVHFLSSPERWIRL